MKSLIEKYRLKLLDHTQRNPLLYFSISLFKGVFIQTNLDTLSETLSDELSLALGSEKFMVNYDEMDKVDKLWSLQKIGLEEKGFNFSHLIYGVMTFSEENFRFPIFIIPVEIKKRNLGLDFYLTFPDEVEGLELNPLLVNYLKTTIELPPDFFAPENLWSNLQKVPKSNIDETCVLGAIDNSSFLIYKDLNPDDWSIQTNKPLSILFGDQVQITPAFDSKIDENPWFLPLDSSQKKSLIQAFHQDVSVIQGPPGTGKTQTICNLALKLAENNQKVLIVSQKQVALEVVAQRIQQIGLGDLTMILNYKHPKAEFVDSLRKSLAKRRKLYNLPPLSPLKVSMNSSLDYTKIEAIIQAKETLGELTGIEVKVSSKELWLEIERMLIKTPGLANERLWQYSSQLSDITTVYQLQKAIPLIKNHLINPLWIKVVELTEEEISLIKEPLTPVVLSWWEKLNSDKRQALQKFIKQSQLLSQKNITESDRKELRQLSIEQKLAFQTLKDLQESLKLSWEDLIIRLTVFSEHQSLLLEMNLMESYLSQLSEEEKNGLWILVKQGLVGKFSAYLSFHELSETTTLDNLQKNQQYLFQLEGIISGYISQVRDMNSKGLLNNYREMLEKLLVKNQNSDFLKFLFREFSRKRKFSSIRTYFRDDGFKFLLKIKPIMLMSPTGVANYLPKEDIFDVVIFDEASQLKTFEALPAILRSKKVVIVGDDQQLPPSNFFNNSEADDESLLDLANSKIESFEKLLWHYRSENPELIAPSNELFYRNELRTFPSHNEESGLSFHYHPETTYDRGVTRTNEQEAEFLLTDLIQLIKQYPEKSFGVATLNLNQKELLEQKFNLRKTEIEKELLKNSEPIFFKNLENVQGDERDFIFLSLGYSKNDQESFSLHLGPLLKNGGERRLNVLFSRARFQMRVYSAIRSIDLENSANRGVQVLKRYLEYAETKQQNQQDLIPSFISSRLGKASKIHPLVDFLVGDKAYVSEKTLFTQFLTTEDRQIFLDKLKNDGFEVHVVSYLSLLFSVEQEMKRLKSFIEKSV